MGRVLKAREAEMIKSPIAQPIKARDQVRVKARRRSQFKVFLHKYPGPVTAWIERLRSRSARRFWFTMFDPFLCPELKVLASAGQEVNQPKSSQELWDAWYRAAITMLVHPKRGRQAGDFTEVELADAFGIAPGRYRNLIIKERAWAKRPTIKPSMIKRRSVIAGQPEAEDLIERLGLI
jgi:hypothetical protein